jgi:hypothetical protein
MTFENSDHRSYRDTTGFVANTSRRAALRQRLSPYAFPTKDHDTSRGFEEVFSRGFLFCWLCQALPTLSFWMVAWR